MSEFRAVAIEAARSAGKLLREGLGGPRRIDYKGHPTNLVTEMDRRSETLIVDTLRQAFPDSPWTDAAALLDELVLSDEFTEFLTKLAYPRLR